VFFIFLFMYAPIVVLMVFSFNSGKGSTWAVWKGFTFEHYIKMFKNAQMMKALQSTLVVALVSAVVATIIGTLAAIGIHNMRKKPKAAVMNVTYLPVLSPDIVTGISLMILFVFLRIPMGRYSMILAHITFNIPYVIISVLPKLSQMNKNMYEAALDLGAKPAYAYRKIILPEIMPGIITGFLFAITLSIDDFVISFFTSGTGTNLSIYIYSTIRKKYDPSINALSTLMFVVIFLLLVLVNSRSGNKDKKKVKRLKKKRIKPLS